MESSMPETGKSYLTYKLDLVQTLATKAADRRYAKAVGLRIRELRVLRLIHQAPGIAATELGHKLVLDKTLISKHVAELERRGLLQRQIDPNDSRIHSLSLTDEGQRVWEVCERIGRELEHEMFGDLDHKAWQHLHLLLDQAYLSVQAWQAEQQPAAARARRAVRERLTTVAAEGERAGAIS